MSVKRTAGVWGRDVAPYRYFTAGTHESMLPSLARSRLLAVNELYAPATEEELLAPLLARGIPILLDSGVFWLANSHAKRHGIPMDQALSLPPEALDDWATLYAQYCRLVAKYGAVVWGYTELDQGGRDQKVRTRAGLEAQGLAPIPVYHPLNDGWDYFDELCHQYDRICVGNVVQAPLPLRTRIFATIWERQRQYPDVWIHYLGVTPMPLQLAYPVQSCDSSAWSGVLRWSSGVRYWTDSALQQLGGLFSREFFYQRGGGEACRALYNRAGNCGVYHAALLQQNWQALLGAYAALGMSPYPPRHARERPVVPAAQ